MSNNVYTLSRDSVESPETVYGWFVDEMKNADLAYDQIEKIGNVTILIIVMERYYFRTNSMAALTVQIVDDGAVQTALVVGTGGGSGVLNIDYSLLLGSANEHLATDAERILKNHGFSE